MFSIIFFASLFFSIFFLFKLLPESIQLIIISFNPLRLIAATLIIGADPDSDTETDTDKESDSKSDTDHNNNNNNAGPSTTTSPANVASTSNPAQSSNPTTSTERLEEWEVVETTATASTTNNNAEDGSSNLKRVNGCSDLQSLTPQKVKTDKIKKKSFQSPNHQDQPNQTNLRNVSFE